MLQSTDYTPSPDGIDFGPQVLCSIGATSHECLLFPDHSLNQPGPTPESVFDDMETDIIDSVLEQNASEKIWLENEANDPRFVLPAL